jgi:pimeloyl-ACP methyl ester carboxylesterase
MAAGAALPPDPRPRIVFVHGLWMTGFELWLLRHRVERMGFRSTRFYYQSAVKPIWHNAAKLADYVKALGPEPVHFVAHSLGGLVILRMLRDHPEIEAGKVVLIGSPVRGSGVAARMNKRFWSRWMVWRAADEALVPEDPQHWTLRHPVGVIAGTQSVGIGHWFGGLEGANDGTVSAEETKLEGAADYIELPLNHSTLLLSKRVARQVAHFLRDGRFARVDPAA